MLYKKYYFEIGCFEKTFDQILAFAKYVSDSWKMTYI